MIRAVTFLYVLALTCTAKAACSFSAVAVLPLRQAGAPFVLTTSINGRDANPALTTGSDRTTINLASARHLGLDMHLSDRQTYGVGGTRKSYFTLAFKNTTIRIVDQENTGIERHPPAPCCPLTASPVGRK